LKTSFSPAQFCCVWLCCLAFSTSTFQRADAASDAVAPLVFLPHSINVNGDEADWKAIAVTQEIKGAQGTVAELKLGYDANSFNAIFVVRDDSPLKNSTSPNDPAMLLKGGDAVGLTFGPAQGVGIEQRILFAMLGGKPVSVVYRPTSIEKKPYTFQSPVGKVTHEYVAPLPEARVAFKTVPGGYNAEIQIPWSTLGYAPREGLLFPFDAQVIFSDPSGQKNASTAWWHSVGSGATATVDLPTEAQLYPALWGKARLYLRAPVVSAVAEAVSTPQDGVPIRFTLPRAAKVSLNITDAKGWVFRELVTVTPYEAGNHIVYWDGRDEYGDALPPGEYSWKLIYFGGIGSKRIGGAGNSARPPFTTADGKGNLGAAHGLPAALASDSKGVYHLGGTEEGNPGLTKLSTDGFAIWKKSLGGFGTGIALDATEKFASMIVKAGGKTTLVTIDPATGQDAPLVGKAARYELGDDKLSVVSLAILNGKAFYGLPDTNHVAVLDLASGEKNEGFAVDVPRDVRRFDDSHLLVVSGSRVLSLDVVNGQTKELLSNLDEPHAALRDGAGNLYVALWGKGQQIVKYSAEGKVLARFGAAGGRTATQIPYEPNAFRDVKSLAFAPDGNLWFMENSQLRRTGVLAPDGKWLRDEFQQLPSQAGAGVDMDDPVRVFFHTGYDSTVMQARVDFAANALDPFNPSRYWKPEAIYNMTRTGDYTPAAPDDIAAKSTAGPIMNPIAFTAKNGKRYLWQEGQTASLWVKEKDRLVPLHVIGGKNHGDGVLFPKDKNFSWSDANGDAKAQPEEISFSDSGQEYGYHQWRWIDGDLTLYGNGGTLAPFKVDARGVPYYRYSDWKRDITESKTINAYFRDGSYGIFPSPPAPDGARYYVFNVGAGQAKSFWDRATYSRIARVKGGKIQWIAGQHDGTKKQDGGASFLWRPLGEVDGTVVVGDVDFQLIAYTSDGFALGGVTPHYYQGIFPENITQENVQSGHFVKDPKTGKRLIIIGSGSEAVVLEVTGIDPKGITRLEGKIALPESSPRSLQTPGQYSILYRTWPQVDNGRNLQVTGDGWGWRPEIPWLQIHDGKTPVADVRLRRDAGALHIYASVLDATPLASMVENEATFGKADGVEVLLGPAEPQNRSVPVVGDTRFFLSAKRRTDNRGEPWEGILLASRPASGDAAFKPIAGAKVAARESLNGQGYHLEAEIPLSFLPELSREREVSYIRNYQPGAKRPGDFVESYTNLKPDLPAPLRFNVAVWQSDGKATAQRVAWVDDGQKDAAMNPSRWGIANALVSLNWNTAGKVRLYRGTASEFADAKPLSVPVKASGANDTPGLGAFYYWAESRDAKGTLQISGPQSVTLGNESATEPVVEFESWRETPVHDLNAIPTQHVFAGAVSTVEIAADGDTLAAKSENPLLKVETTRIENGRWRLTLRPDAQWKLTDSAPVQLTSTRAGKSQNARFTVAASSVRLAGLLTKTGGVLGLQSANLEKGVPLATVNWPGTGSLTQRAIGSRGYVQFRRGGISDAKPTRRVLAPFKDTFGDNDGFWYGEWYSNMRFDIDSKEGRDAKGMAFFGSVNTNAGTPDDGPRNSWKIEVADTAKHLMTVFSPASGSTGASQSITVTTADGSTQTVRLDGTQGGAVAQFEFIGNATLTLQQNSGGSGSARPGASAAVLFFD
jgi:hypothetical protein